MGERQRDQMIDEAAALVRQSESVLFITGAGISADSGLPTYRGVGGLYDGRVTEGGVPIEVALSGEMFRMKPALTWRHILEIERACRGAAPNAGHRAIAELERRGDRRVWTLTQNVDGLHHAAGSRQVIAIHGDVHALSCTRCDWREAVEDYAHLGEVLPPRCGSCEAVIRPDVVLFNEQLPVEALAVLERELAQGFDLVISVGTTSAFPYIAWPVLDAARAGTPTIEINPGPTEVSDAVRLKLAMGAADALGAILARLDA